MGASGEQLEGAIEQLRTVAATWSNMPICAVLVDSKGRFVHVNPAFADALGYDAEGIEGKTIFDFLVPEEHEQRQREMAAVGAWVESGKQGPNPLAFAIRTTYRRACGGRIYMTWLRPREEVAVSDEYYLAFAIPGTVCHTACGVAPQQEGLQ